MIRVVTSRPLPRGREVTVDHCPGEEPRFAVVVDGGRVVVLSRSVWDVPAAVLWQLGVALGVRDRLLPALRRWPPTRRLMRAATRRCLSVAPRDRRRE